MIESGRLPACLAGGCSGPVLRIVVGDSGIVGAGYFLVSVAM
jgi:hypothetical protein